VFVADAHNCRIQVFTRDGQFIRMWGSVGMGPGQFRPPSTPPENGTGPWGVAVDNQGLLYVTDPSNFRIQVFSEDGVFKRQFGGLRTPGGDWNTPRAIAAVQRCGQLNTPAGIAIGPSGDVFVATAGWYSTPGAYTVQVFSPDGTCLRRWGADGDGRGQFESPHGVAVDARGDVFVTDLHNRVQRFRSDGRFELQWPQTSHGRLRHPAAITADAAGHVYVAESTNRRLQQFTSDGEFLAMWTAREDTEYRRRLRFPSRIAADVDGRVYVAELDRVLVLSSSGETLDVWERDEQGWERFDGPCSIAVDGSGQVYVVNWHARSVTALTRAGQQVWQIKGLRNPFAVAAVAGERINAMATVHCASGSCHDRAKNSARGTWLRRARTRRWRSIAKAAFSSAIGALARSGSSRRPGSSSLSGEGVGGLTVNSRTSAESPSIRLAMCMSPTMASTGCRSFD
jgi:DNA-binding beta-propeller fold protein YncE